MDNRPIGVFDSGMGGLTALRELIRLLPGEDMVYFGDNARIPYGTKSPEVIKRFALQDARFLAQTGVKAMLVACGTVSSTCIEDIRKAFPEMPVIGVVAAAAKKAAGLKEKERIRLGDVDVTNKYDKEKNVTYTNYKIFSFETQNEIDGGSRNTESPEPKKPVDDGDVDDDRLPF